jgi:TetR/AcrR family transcriptional regulator, transcriptional repressor for nem operon
MIILLGMRYATGHKNKSRTQIVRSAAAQLRAKGVEAVRLADMMQAAGMTNGGFYKHFKNKDEIVVEAVCRALNDLAEQLTDKVQGMPRSEALQSIIEFYLSEEHLRHPEHGCAIAALGSELARMPLRMKRRVNEALDAYAERLSPLMPGVSEELRHTAFRVLFSSMAGCLTAARAEADEGKRSVLLRAGRSFFVRAFCGADGQSNREMRQ